MVGEKVRKLTKLMFTGLTMALCVAAFSPAAKTEAAMLQESEPNDNPATANKLPLNTWLKGDTEHWWEEDWYQFTIPQGGMTQIQLVKDNESTNTTQWYVKLEDANRHEITSGYTSSLDYKIGLAPGKYFFKVERDGGIYNLRVNHTASTLWEQERYYGEKSLANANIAYANKIYTGMMYCYRDVDWYRFKLTGNNKLSLRFTIDDSVANPSTWRVELQEYNSRKALGSYYVNANETLTVNKCSGDFVVKICSYGSVEDDIYHLQLTSKPITTAKPATKPATVKNPAATAITSIKAGKRSATLRWKKASNATGYYVYRATSPRGTYKKVATVTGKTYYTDKKSLKSKKNYYYKVVSIRKSGSKVLKAKASGYKGVKIK